MATTIMSLKNFDIAQDGSKAVLHFADDQDRPVSLKFDFIGLERLVHGLVSVVSKTRQLSALTNRGVDQVLRPAGCRAYAATGEPTVIVGFQLPNGLEILYGIESSLADA